MSFLTATDIPSIQQQQSHHQLNPTTLMPTNNNYNSKVHHSSQLQNVTAISNNSINDHTFTSIGNGRASFEYQHNILHCFNKLIPSGFEKKEITLGKY